MWQSRHENAIGYGRSDQFASTTEGVKIEEGRSAAAKFARFFTADSHRVPFPNHPWRFGVDRKAEWLGPAAGSIH